jgi:hypothetical protein
MTVNWYNIGNRNEFEAKGIPQEAFTRELEDLGQQEIVFLKGFSFSVIFMGEMLMVGMNGRNPFFRNKASCYIDPETSDVWVGYETDM